MAQLPGPAVPRTALLSFPRGLQELVDALAAAMGGRLHLSSGVESIEGARPGWKVRFRGSDTLVADRLVLAVPAPAAAGLLAPLDSLRGVRHASVTLVHLGLSRAEVSRLPRGFGYLVPPDAAVGGSRLLGTLFASNLFPGRAPDGCAAMSSFYSSADVEHLKDRDLAALACEDLARALGERLAPVPVAHAVLRWKDAIPRYAPGHAERMGELASSAKRDLEGLHLAGSYVAGLSVDQVIARGRAVAAEILG
jgi:oxygen-dependent protoporphyrinogen oxidase